MHHLNEERPGLVLKDHFLADGRCVILKIIEKRETEHLETRL